MANFFALACVTCLSFLLWGCWGLGSLTFSPYPSPVFYLSGLLRLRSSLLASYIAPNLDKFRTHVVAITLRLRFSFLGIYSTVHPCVSCSCCPCVCVCFFTGKLQLLQFPCTRSTWRRGTRTLQGMIAVLYCVFRTWPLQG